MVTQHRNKSISGLAQSAGVRRPLRQS